MKVLSASEWEQMVDAMVDAVQSGRRADYLNARRTLIAERQAWLVAATKPARRTCTQCENAALTLCGYCRAKYERRRQSDA